MDGFGEKQDRLDGLIARALQGDPQLKAPVTLLQGVEERLRIAELRDREQRRFRYSMVMFASMAGGALFLAAAGLWLTSLHLISNVGVSGGKGFFDYYTTALVLGWDHYRGAYTLVLSILLGVATLAAAVLPLRKYFGGSH